MNPETVLEGKKYVSFIRVLAFSAFCLAAITNVLTYESPLHRILASTVIEDEQIFQITVTGVPDRVPSLAENMVLEAALYHYLKRKLAESGERIYTVRVTPDKTIHYRRSLNEHFSVIGEEFSSNGSIELKKETLDKINDHNQRILGSVDEDDIIHQIALLILIKGSHISSVNIGDYDSLVVDAINDGYSEIKKALEVPSTTYTESAHDYFKEVQAVICVGVGPRDGEPHLEMIDQNEQEIVSARASSSQSSERHEPQKMSSLNQEKVPMSKLSRDSYDLGTESSDTKDMSYRNTKPLHEDPFNAEAIQFRLVSFMFFMIICTVTGFWYVGKIVARRREERRTKMNLAKKVYDGPRKEQSSALFSDGKYTGTMDTGTGL